MILILLLLFVVVQLESGGVQQSEEGETFNIFLSLQKYIHVHTVRERGSVVVAMVD